MHVYVPENVWKTDIKQVLVYKMKGSIKPKPN